MKEFFETGEDFRRRVYETEATGNEPNMPTDRGGHNNDPIDIECDEDFRERIQRDNPTHANPKN